MKTGYDQFFKKAKQTSSAQNRTEVSTQQRLKELRSLKNQSSNKKPKKRFPAMQFVLFSILGLAGFLAIDHIDTIEDQFKKIEIF